MNYLSLQDWHFNMESQVLIIWTPFIRLILNWNLGFKSSHKCKFRFVFHISNFKHCKNIDLRANSSKHKIFCSIVQCPLYECFFWSMCTNKRWNLKALIELLNSSLTWTRNACVTKVTIKEGKCLFHFALVHQNVTFHSNGRPFWQKWKNISNFQIYLRVSNAL